MKQIDRIKSILSGLARTLTRFPLTVIFLIAATILNAVVISTSNEKYHKQLFLTFLIGAFVSILFHHSNNCLYS
ncbi:MAG TPA: hypothetical protein VJ888_07420 [Mobilitalea sp.]|nr:hypothetical protein [Mobilitalea sp.]